MDELLDYWMNWMLGSLVMAKMDEALYEGMDDAATQAHGALEC